MVVRRAGDETPVNSAKEILVQEVERLSEKDAQEVLDLLRTKKTGAVAPEKPQLTREELIKRAAGHPGIHAPDPNAPPFEKIEPIECPGIPASELLIRDRR
jgi:DNA-directed RNA polymerase subunit H (RpoH/RPB5)